MKLTWLTDLHFEFINDAPAPRFIVELAKSNPEAVVITGDIANARELERNLLWIAKNLTSPVYFVLGNHDFYRGSVRRVDQLVAEICRSHPHLHHLGGGEVIKLTPKTGLVGHRGWGDGLAGNGVNTMVGINDQHYIKDLAVLDTKELLFGQMEHYGKMSAEYFRNILPIAFEKYEHVLIATHVPPFPGAAWYMGENTDADHLPFFCNQQGGEAILTVARQYPRKKITILCGHTHYGGRYEIENIVCLTGSAVYGVPKVEAVLKIAGSSLIL